MSQGVGSFDRFPRFWPQLPLPPSSPSLSLRTRARDARSRRIIEDYVKKAGAGIVYAAAAFSPEVLTPTSTQLLRPSPIVQQNRGGFKVQVTGEPAPKSISLSFDASLVTETDERK